VRERFAEPISLAEVADAAGVGAAHLARRWRREVGCSVGDSLRALRLAEARRLLAGRPQTVLAIALRCGFNSVEHFHRTFRAALGTSPAAWRRRALAEGEGEEER
jgi:AraC family transcriptional regulator